MRHARQLLIALVGLGLVLVAPPAVEAGPRVAQAKRGKRDAKRAKRRDRIRQRIRAARQWKLTEALELDEDTADKLFPILDGYDDKFVKVMTGGRKLRRALRKAIEGGASDKKINGIVDDMLDNQRAIWKLNEQRFQAARKVLSAEQAAKALIVLPEIDRAIRHELHRAMQGRRRGPPGHRGPPPPPDEPF